MRKSEFVTICTALVCLSTLCTPIRAQESRGVGGVQSLGISSSFSNDSSHILIGQAEGRRVWTVGVDYTHRLYSNPYLRLDYAASLIPYYEESDPTLLGTTFTFNGQTFFTADTSSPTPQRVVYVAKAPVGTINVPGNPPAPIYVVFGHESTYAGAVSPLGAIITARPSHRIQPTFAVNLGFVASVRDIPVNDSAQFNYLFDFGPGVRLFENNRTSLHLEYIYRHTSNAGQGNQNPGVDQGVIRVTMSIHR